MRHAGAYLKDKCAALEQAVMVAEARVSKGARDDEAVHDLRVAIRRLRTALEVSRSIFGPWHANTVRRAFTEVMQATGDLRDEEVLEGVLAQATTDPAFVAWARARVHLARELRRDLAFRVEGGELERAGRLLRALLAFPIREGRDEELVRFVAKTIRRARRTVRNLSGPKLTDERALHDLRIAYKRLRYAGELFYDVLSASNGRDTTDAMLAGAAAFQKRLGDIHDVDVAIAIVNHSNELGTRARRKALAGLARLRHKRVRKYLRLTPLDAVQDTRHAHATR